mgnify:CR=1 FL=1
MAESRIKDENYYQVSGWMLNRLGLKGTALEVYAIIYAFSQDGESCFTGSLQYLSDFTNTSRQTVITTLKNLVESGYLVKREALVNGVKYNDYRAVTNPPTEGSQKTLPVVKNLDGGGEKTLTGVVKKLDGGGQKSLPHNKEHNTTHKKEHKELCAKVSKKAVAEFFDSIWKLYPVKKGKGQVSEAKRKALYQIGYEEMARAIDRYKKDLKKDASWRKPQNGSTFFNSGYVDYLDENYSQGGEIDGSAEKSVAQYGTML